METIFNTKFNRQETIFEGSLQECIAKMIEVTDLYFDESEMTKLAEQGNWKAKRTLEEIKFRKGNLAAFGQTCTHNHIWAKNGDPYRIQYFRFKVIK